MKQFLETGKIVNTHGIRGEVKIQPWSNSPDFLTDFKTIYIDGQAHRVRSWRIQKEMLVASIAGIESVDDAIHYKNKIVYIDRKDAKLDEGEFFIQDILGFDILDDETGAVVGKLKDVMPMPAGNIYVIGGEREILVPAVPEFIKETDLEAGTIRIHFLEGM